MPDFFSIFFIVSSETVVAKSPELPQAPTGKEVQMEMELCPRLSTTIRVSVTARGVCEHFTCTSCEFDSGVVKLCSYYASALNSSNCHTVNFNQCDGLVVTRGRILKTAGGLLLTPSHIDILPKPSHGCFLVVLAAPQL